MELENRARGIAASMLKTNKLQSLDPKEFDEDLLDHAKELGHEYIHTFDKNSWIIRHFSAGASEFVQVQSPNRKIKYFVPLTTEGLSFKDFLLAEERGFGYWLRAQLAEAGKNYYSDIGDEDDFTPEELARIKKAPFPGMAADNMRVRKAGEKKAEWLRKNSKSETEGSTSSGSGNDY